MLFLLGWAARLVKYYKDGSPTGELTVPDIKSEREIELQVIADNNTFEIGQVLEATITSIKGNRVTYRMLDTILLTEKEPKFVKKDNPTEGSTQKVEILALKEMAP